MNPGSSVKIRSAQSASTVEFTVFRVEKEAVYFRIRLDDSASQRFFGDIETSTYFAGPPSHFFVQMAERWRGWEGKIEWQTLERDLKLAATCDALGHVCLVVETGDFHFHLTNGFLLKTYIWLEAGQLESIANQMNKLFAVEAGA